MNIDCIEIADFKGAIFHHKYQLQVTTWIGFGHVLFLSGTVSTEDQYLD
ncbi:hypothetical protein HanRHA438_Chr11g0487921 [Helianthus annuus]|nr:hypothetical protein HanIR_Chr11g0511391 [Helianthus annuus]KAJ0869324.1 hypothetical protein HanRHA438_Chr11g0487921 [Helianthus annuus]